MKNYQVTISFRPNINRLARVERSFRISAASKTSAQFQAAYQLGRAQESYLGGSEIVTVTQIGLQR